MVYFEQQDGEKSVFLSDNVQKGYIDFSSIGRIKARKGTYMIEQKFAIFDSNSNFCPISIPLFKWRLAIR